MNTFVVDFDSTFAMRFTRAPLPVRWYYEQEFPDRVMSESQTPALISVSFQKILIPSVNWNIGARAIHGSDAFFLRDGKGHHVQLDFAHLSSSEPFEIRADHDVQPRFLHQVVEAFTKALAPYHGHIFVHSSSFRAQNSGVLIAAWAHTGKTNTLLSFLSRGADFYGDDWSILSGRQLISYPKTLNLFGYNLAHFPSVKRKLPLQFRAVFGVTSLLGHLLAPLARGSSQLAHYASTLLELVKNQGHVRMSVEKLFPNVKIGTPTPLAIAILPQRSSGQVDVFDMTSSEFADRMIPCLRMERSKLLEWYAMYQFAFPGRTSDVLERLEETEMRCLREQTAGCRVVKMNLGDGQDLETIQRNIQKLL